VYYKAAARAASSIRGNASGRSIALARFAILSLLPPAGRPKSHGRSMTRLQVGYSMPRCRQGWWLKQRAGLGLVDSLRPPIRRDPAGNPRRPCDPPRRGWVRSRRGFGSSMHEAGSPRSRIPKYTHDRCRGLHGDDWMEKTGQYLPFLRAERCPFVGWIARALASIEKHDKCTHTHTHIHTRAHAPTHTHNLYKRDAIAERNVYRRSRELISPVSKKDLSLSLDKDPSDKGGGGGSVVTWITPRISGEFRKIEAFSNSLAARGS